MVPRTFFPHSCSVLFLSFFVFALHFRSTFRFSSDATTRPQADPSFLVHRHQFSQSSLEERRVRDANGDVEDRSIVGCNVIIPRGVCGRVSNLGSTDAAYVSVCVCLCTECNKVYNTRSDKPCVRRTDRTSAYPRALFKIAGD